MRIMVPVFHHLSKPDEFMQNTLQYLKPDGRLVITVVLNKRNPQAKPRTSTQNDPCVSDPEETKRAIEKMGFAFEKVAMHDDPNPSVTVIFSRCPADLREMAAISMQQ